MEDKGFLATVLKTPLESTEWPEDSSRLWKLPKSKWMKFVDSYAHQVLLSILGDFY